MSVRLMLRATEREAMVWTRLWQSSVFGIFVSPVLLLVAMGIGLGALVDDETRDLGGLDYLTFITPGVLVAAAAQAATGNSLWPVTAGHRWLGFHHAQVATPMAAGDVYGGMVLWTGLRALMQATVLLAAGAVLGGVPSWWGVLAIPAAAATATAFAAPFAAFAATQDSDMAFDPILRVVIGPLYLFSGTLFPIEQLPGAIQAAAMLFPLWHGVELARAATTGAADAASVVLHVAVLAAYIGAGWWWGLRSFAGRLTP